MVITSSPPACVGRQRELGDAIRKLTHRHLRAAKFRPSRQWRVRRVLGQAEHRHPHDDPKIVDVLPDLDHWAVWGRRGTYLVTSQPYQVHLTELARVCAELSLDHFESPWLSDYWPLSTTFYVVAAKRWNLLQELRLNLLVEQVGELLTAEEQERLTNYRGRL